MSLTSQIRRALKSKAHKLHPIVIIGSKGLTESVLAEIDAALQIHELIKIRVNAEDRAQRQTMIDQICEHTLGECVSTIGHIAVLYRLKETQ